MSSLVATYHDLKHWVVRQFILQKLNNPLGFVILLMMSLALGYIFVTSDIKIAAVLVGAILGIPIVLGCLFNQQFAMIVIIAISVFVEFFRKYGIPAGIALDGLLVVALFGIIIAQINDRRIGFAKSPISMVIWLWVSYTIIQVLNPVAESQLAWLYTVRSLGLLILFYFIACYTFTSLKQIRTTFKLILYLAFFSALYGLKQEFLGFSDREMEWLYSDPERFQRIFQWSRLRIFSFFSDPTTYGIYMGYMGTICFVLMAGPFANKRKAMLFIAGAAMFLSMAYAGSRTPFVLVPFGFLVFVMLTLKKNILMIMGVVFILGVGFMAKSSSNAVIFRIQSAFNPETSDDTMQVRLENQARIQPFIHKHPFGAGLGSTGLWGQRFTPDSWLADFAHDSGFVRIAVEMGWVGLLIYAGFLFLILRLCIYYYVRVRNPEIKIYYLVLCVFFFMMTLASYPQEAIILLPNSIIFYTLLAMLVKLKDFDEIEKGDKNYINSNHNIEHEVEYKLEKSHDG